MIKCRRFQPSGAGCRENCVNCKRWNGIRCKDEKDLTKQYEETEEFKIFDHMMRTNRGLKGPL